MVFYNNCRVMCARCEYVYSVLILATQYWHEPHVVELCLQIFSAVNTCPNCKKAYDNKDEIVSRHLLCKPIEEIKRGEWDESNL